MSQSDWLLGVIGLGPSDTSRAPEVPISVRGTW